LKINDYINPELLILVPFLNIIGKWLKPVKFIDNKHIPAILGILGIIFACAYGFFVLNGGSAATTVITGIVKGVLIAGASVYSDQICKQYSKNQKDCPDKEQ